MELISKEDTRLQFPAFYNCYPIHNEIHITAIESLKLADEKGDYIYLDDLYGRFLEKKYYENSIPYGDTAKMNFYPSTINLDIVDEYRVPYRKIPVFKIDHLSILTEIITKLEKDNPGYEVLLRGQNKTYTIQRQDEEKIKLYGNHTIKEPSFLPSHLRNNFDEYFMQSMWQTQASYLLEYIGYQFQQRISIDELNAYSKDIFQIKYSQLFLPFSLGIAQHYGLPSIGLDLTKTINVAAWFALNRMLIDDTGFTTIAQVDKTYMPTIFVFRCPKNSIFPYKVTRPKHFPEGRPDRQDAWFGHVGWGNSKNQLGGYLMYAFQLDIDILNFLPKKYEEFLFPKIAEDPILEYFVKSKAHDKYEGNARKVLQKVYHLG